jgi:hypothetical protein
METLLLGDRELSVWGHVRAWWVVLMCGLMLPLGLLGTYVWFATWFEEMPDLKASELGEGLLFAVLGGAGLVAGIWLWPRYWYRARDFEAFVRSWGGVVQARSPRRVRAQLGPLEALAELDRPFLDYRAWPRPRWPYFKGEWVGSFDPHYMFELSRISFRWTTQLARLPEACVSVLLEHGQVRVLGSLPEPVAAAVRAAFRGVAAERVELELTTGPRALCVRVWGGTWLGSAFAERIDHAHAFARQLVAALSAEHPALDPAAR